MAANSDTATPNSPSTSSEVSPMTSSKNDMKGCQRVVQVIGNGRKKILLISKARTGKSSLCNVIAGLEHDSEFFRVSDNPDLSSQSINFGDVLFAGDISRPVTLMNTLGFDDPTQSKHDAKLFSDIVAELRACCDYVNLFAIAINGRYLELDDSVTGMIRIFEEMFEEKFWANAVIIITQLPMDESSIRRRFRAKRKTDEEMFAEFFKVVQEKFPKSEGVKHLHLDACYDEGHPEESEIFNKTMDKLWDMLVAAPKLKTLLMKSTENDQTLMSRVAAHEKYLAQLIEGMEIEKKKVQSQSLGNQQALEDKKRQLQNDYEHLLQQKQHELDEMRKAYENDKKTQRSIFENEVQKLIAQIPVPEPKEIDQGKTNKETYKKSNEQPKSKQKLQENLNKKIKEIEDRLQIGVHKVEKDTEMLSATYASQLDKWIAHKKGDTFKDGWRINAFSKFHSIQGSVSVKSETTVKAMEKDYPDSHWVLFVFCERPAAVIGAFTMRQTDGCSVISKGGEQAMENNLEDEDYGLELFEPENAKNPLGVVAGKPQTVPLALYVWRVLKSHCKELRQATTDERKEVAGIVQNLKEMEKKGIKWSNKRWRDKLVSQMDKTETLAAWKHVVVANEIQFWSKSHSQFLLSGNTKAHICFTQT